MAQGLFNHKQSSSAIIFNDNNTVHVKQGLISPLRRFTITMPSIVQYLEAHLYVIKGLGNLYICLKNLIRRYELMGSGSQPLLYTSLPSLLSLCKIKASLQHDSLFIVL